LLRPFLAPEPAKWLGEDTGHSNSQLFSAPPATRLAACHPSPHKPASIGHTVNKPRLPFMVVVIGAVLSRTSVCKESERPAAVTSQTEGVQPMAATWNNFISFVTELIYGGQLSV
ncbi:MAG: hypothetical protein ACOC8X_02310, partial [Chloroflexota bacterium]